MRRLLTYFSFVISSLILGARRAARPDVVVVELPPLFLGLSGYAISRLRRAKLVLNVSDLWPESAVAMGILRNGLLIGLSTRLEEFLYRCSDLVTGQTEGIVQSIRSRFPKKRLGLITNGVDLGAVPRAFAAGGAPESSGGSLDSAMASSSATRACTDTHRVSRRSFGLRNFWRTFRMSSSPSSETAP